MGFLSPLLLVLGLAAAIPIVLHLFQRHQGPRLVFPALRYLRRAEKESARRIRLRQILLLALRVAAIVLIALAAARPFLRAGGAGHEPTAAVIVLDNSLSTGLVAKDRRVLDDLKARALQITAQAAPDDRFWVIRAGTPWDPAVPGDAASAAARIRDTDVAAADADLRAALARARALLAAGAERRAREIDLVSDLQATSFVAPITAGRETPPVVAWVPAGDVPPNAGIADVQVGGGLAPRAGERSTVQARVAGSRTDSVGVRLTLDGRTSAVAHAAAGSTAILPFPARPAGLATGFVELDPDALRGDDRRYFAVTVEPPPLVALTGAAPFADAALSVLADAGRIRRGDAGAADVIVAPGGAGAAGVPAGRTVAIVAPASPLELPGANQRLGVVGIPWRFLAPQSAGEARFETRDTTDDLSRALAAARVRQVYPLQRQGTGVAGDSVMVRLADGSAWAVRGTLPSGGRYILVASPFSTEATTLPTTSAMVPLLDHITGSWASRAAERSEAAPGASIQLPAGADHVLRPDGVRDSASADYFVPAVAGLYRVLANNHEIAAFAVNAPATESDLRRLSARRFEAMLPGWDVETATTPRAWARDVFRHRLGHETWRPLALLLLALLIMEAIAATAGRARVATGGVVAARSRRAPVRGGVAGPGGSTVG